MCEKVGDGKDRMMLEHKEKCKEENQLKDGGIGQGREKNKNKKEQNHGLDRLDGVERGRDDNKRGRNGNTKRRKREREGREGRRKECKTLVMKRMQ